MFVALYRLLLRIYPPAFRERFGEEMAVAFERGRQNASTRRAAVWFVVAGIGDAVVNGIRERRSVRLRDGRASVRATLTATMSDLRFAWRMLSRNPRLAILATGTLALGIALTVALFSVAHSALLRRLPYPQEDRVVMLWEFAPEKDAVRSVSTPANFLDWRERTRSFSHVGGIAPYSATLASGGSATQVRGRRVTADVFGALGVQPAIGRPFASDDERESVPVVILGHRTWVRHFGSDPGIVGRSILLDERARTVVGIMPAEFKLPGGEDDVLIPFVFSAWERRARKSHWVRVVARLKPAVTFAAAQADATAVAAQLAAEYPDANKGETILLEPIRDAMVGELRPALLTLVGAVAAVLLIACVNVANLLLANATARRREMAVRIAIGAGRLRLVRQLAAESLLLALVAASLGLAGSYVCLQLLARVLPDTMNHVVDLRMDPRVALASAALCILTATMAGLSPIVGVWNGASAAGGSRVTAAPGVARMRRSLVVAQVALAVVLLTSAGLIMRSFMRLTSVELGFRPDNLLSFRTELPRSRYAGPAEWKPFFERLTDELESIPGVVSAAGVGGLPLNMDGGSNAIFVEGRPAPPPNENTFAIYRLVTPRYFSTIGIPVLEGRDFTSDDRTDGLRVAAVNRTMAERMWPGERAIGKRLTFSRTPGPSDWITIVAVVGDTHHGSLAEPIDIQMYAPYTQEPNWFPPVEIVIRTTGQPTAIAAAVRERMRTIDPLLPLEDLQPLQSLVARSVAEPRFNLLLLATLGISALTMASIGLYGLLSFSVALRGKEIAVRAALGASRRDLSRLVVGEGMGLTATGLAVGFATALFLTRSIRSILFEIEPHDPTTFLAVAALLSVIAAAACFIPARRAARVDPLVALRIE